MKSRKYFLGKAVPEPPSRRVKHRVNPPFSRYISAILPLVALAGFLHAQFIGANLPSLDRTVGSSVRIFAQASETMTIHILTNNGTPVERTDTSGKKRYVCDFRYYFLRDNNLIREKIFPLIPDELRADPGRFTIMTDPGNHKLDYNPCATAYWDKNVVFFFVIKFLAILNWFAGVLAVILTAYAGVLYIAGFANEGNVKKAKTLLIGAYTGLIIVFMARIIVYGVVNFYTDQKAEDALKNPGGNIPITNE